MLRDSKVTGAMNGNGKGVIQLLQSVVSVCLEEKLLMTIVARTDGGVECQDTIDFTPDISGRNCCWCHQDAREGCLVTDS